MPGETHTVCRTLIVIIRTTPPPTPPAPPGHQEPLGSPEIMGALGAPAALQHQETCRRNALGWCQQVGGATFVSVMSLAAVCRPVSLGSPLQVCRPAALTSQSVSRTVSTALSHWPSTTVPTVTADVMCNPLSVKICVHLVLTASKSRTTSFPSVSLTVQPGVPDSWRYPPSWLRMLLTFLPMKGRICPAVCPMRTMLGDRLPYHQ